MIRVLHIVTGLATGGAETMLLKIIQATPHLDHHVLSLLRPGEIGDRIASLGVPVRSALMNRTTFSPASFLRLAREIRKACPDVIQTWMYHADLLGGIAARLITRAPVAWNLRASVLAVEGISTRTRLVARLCALLSPLVPARIVCGSEAARRAHTELGYSPEKMLVIPNGFDIDTFRPDAAARASVRAELGIPERAVVLALFGRLDPLKDHRTFFAAAAQISAQEQETHYILCGEGVTAENPAVQAMVGEVPRERLHLLGRRTDVPRLSAAVDIGCLSSYSEGFPNVIGELMSCGVPCVVTDVGDAADIVGETGAVVPPRDPGALAAAALRMIRAGSAERQALGAAARERIATRYSLSVVAALYERTYIELHERRRARHR